MNRKFKLKYLFANLQTFFSEFYFFGFQNHFKKRRFLYLLNFSEKNSNFFQKINIHIVNFLKYYINFIYLFLVFLEVRSLNTYIYYITSFSDQNFTLNHKSFAGFYNNIFGNYEGISNQLMYPTLKQVSVIENFIFPKTGLILNFSSFFHTMSALRFFRNTDNIVCSVDYSNFVDYVMFNNLNTNNLSEQFMYSFFYDYAAQHNHTYALKQILVRAYIANKQCKRQNL